MPAKITLKINKGKLSGQEFVFAERTSCILGRAHDCSPKLPEDAEHQTISRNHCLLDINPPDIRVRDFGSKNGTFVNGKKIGQREQHMSAEDGAKMQFPEHELKDGDQIELGDTVFRVGIFVPTVCTECSKEIPEAKKAKAQRAPGIFQCDVCRAKAEKANIKAPPKPKPKVCAKCGRDVSKEMGEHRHGDFVCSTCKADPMEILKLLLEMAKSGNKELIAIQGYIIEKELGRGGMGAAYLARHDKTGERVALKVMLPKVAASPDARETFLRETENTKALKHRHVVQLRDAGCSNGTFFFTMEFCDGGSVDRLMLQRGGKLSVDEACKIMLGALEGLEYAHHAEIPKVKLKDGSYGRGRGLVHRDLKPPNIFLSGAGSARMAKVGDYGLSKAFDSAGLSGRTRTGTVAGTPVFMPRQQVIDFKYAKPEVDVWAMAARAFTIC
ncbi:MAG: FHA domain-containing protein [Verrucomicrobiae bacterium]|nr:FHA domain-containing protein [Verrucomicrobiae bacterium]